MSYDKWLSFPFRKIAKKYFPKLFKKQTGIELSDDWKTPPINSITQTYVNRMIQIGFESHQDVDSKYSLTGISLPLLKDRRQLGGFLTAYRARSGSDILRWVKYTHPELVVPETPLIAISGPFRTKPRGLLVDNLCDYFKLLNWVYCQENTYIDKWHSGRPTGWSTVLPLIIYVDQGDEGAIEQMRKMQMHFSHLTDFTGKFVDEIKSKMNRTQNTFNVDTLHYFDESPLPYCKTRIEFEDAVSSLRSSYRRKTLLECSETMDSD